MTESTAAIGDPERLPALRIFSYLPNPRLAKATIAARLCGVTLEVRGATPRELAGWLWDFDARPLEVEDTSAGTVREARVGFAGTLHKTDTFLAAHPFGAVPAAFSPDGKTGIFESNAIARAVVRLAPERTSLYGDDPYAASRIDAFLDASLVFARDVQVYLLKLASGRVKPPTHERAGGARDAYLAGIEQALAPGRAFLVGRAHACRHRVRRRARAPLYAEELRETHPRALAHFARLCVHWASVPDLGPYLEKFDNQRSPP